MALKFEHLPNANSLLGRLDPRWKLSGILPAMLAAVLVRNPSSTVAAFAGCIVLALLSRMFVRWLLLRLGLVSLFLIPFAVLLPLLFFGKDRAWWVVGLGIYLKTLSVVMLALVALTTAPLTDTLKAAHALRVPSLLVQFFMLTYHYVFELSRELARMRVALGVRGYRTRANGHTYRTIAHLAGTLLVRGSERAERVQQAMRCRAFSGRYRSLAEFRTGLADVTFFFLLLILSAGLCVWDFLV